tara:strand:+ start:17 stop:280 length:264 start_codon:yes stop_codon:yes gene_type:complete
MGKKNRVGKFFKKVFLGKEKTEREKRIKHCKRWDGGCSSNEKRELGIYPPLRDSGTKIVYRRPADKKQTKGVKSGNPQQTKGIKNGN